jgi:subtilisin family serine protease
LPKSKPTGEWRIATGEPKRLAAGQDITYINAASDEYVLAILIAIVTRNATVTKACPQKTLEVGRDRFVIGRPWRLPSFAAVTVVAVAFLFGLTAKAGATGKTHPAQDGRSGFQKYLLVLSAQADLTTAKNWPAKSREDLRRRHEWVVRELQRVAQETQPVVLDGLRDLRSKGLVNTYLAFFVSNIVSVEANPAALAALRALPQVESVELDLPIAPLDEPSHTGGLDEPGTEPGLRAIRAPEVWDMGITGAGVLLAHLDTGVNGSHPALAGRWRGSYGYPASACWLDLVGSSTTPTDAIGHGTQTMGIMCGTAPGDTIGVAWGARYISARINLASGATIASTALAAFQWLLDPDGDPSTFDDVPRVESNSWGLDVQVYPPCFSLFNTAVDNCETAGIALFWGAGNEGDRGASTIRVPADRVQTLVSSFSVGAHDVAVDSIWYRSSRGPSPCSADPQLRIKPEVVAPGRGIRSAYLGTSYAVATGTSFSTAHAAGVAALMLEVNPFLSPDSLKRILYYTAVDKGERGDDNTYGAGFVDALAAVYGAMGGVGWVAGRVTDAYGYNLMTTVRVADDPHRVRTDSTGHYALAMPAGLPFQLVASAELYETFSQWVVLNPGDTTVVDPVLMLQANIGVLTGTVMGCLGVPAAGALVRVVNAGVPDSYTNAQGRFRVLVPAGVYTVTASDGYCADGNEPNVQIVGRGITDIEIVLPANPAYLCSNPDPFGYRACDSHDPGGPVFQWRELAPLFGGDGMVLNLGEDACLPVALPFSIRFYGVSRDRMYINSNGDLSFVRGLMDYINTALPRRYAPAVLAFWVDLSDNSGGDICTSYDPARGEYVIEWSHVPRYDGEGDETFQIVVHDPAALRATTGNAVWEVYYNDLHDIDECTIGLDANQAGAFVQYVFNGNYSVDATPLHNGHAIRFISGELLNEQPALSLTAPLMELAIPQGSFVDTALVIENHGNGPAAYAVSVEGSVPAAHYSWTTSRDAGGPPFEFMDIASIGQPTGLVRDDTTSDPWPLPWLFPFFGRYYDRVAISSNGYLSFTSCIYDLSWQHYPLWDGREPHCAVAPYWTDLDVSRGGAIVAYYDPPRDRFIVQWNQIRRWSESGRNTFQALLYHDGRIEFVYAGMASPLNNGTVGLKGRNPSQAVQLAYNQAFIQSNTLVRFTSPDSSARQCILLDNQQGVIAPASNCRVPIRLVNNSDDNSRASWQLRVSNSDSLAGELMAQVSVQNFADPSGLQVVIRPQGTGVVLLWNPVPGPLYCVYSGLPSDSGLPRFEACVADTCLFVPDLVDEVRIFEVRLCNGPPSDGRMRRGQNLPSAKQPFFDSQRLR